MLSCAVASKLISIYLAYIKGRQTPSEFLFGFFKD